MSDRESVSQWLAKRTPWKDWDPRVLRLHIVEHGFRPIPQQGDAVTLKCNKWQEAQSYTYADYVVAFELFATICKNTPIHIIWGAVSSFKIRPGGFERRLAGHFAASVTQVEDAAHLVIQEKPDAVAQVISDALNTIQLSPSTSSKL